MPIYFMKKDESHLTNLTKFYLFTVLTKKPMHGYEIIDELGKLLGKKPSPGQIYPLINSLEKKGFLSQKAEYTGKKRKKVYTLTKAGKILSVDLLKRLSGIVEIAIEPNLTSCYHCACKIYMGGYKKKIGSKILNFCCSSCASTTKCK